MLFNSFEFLIFFVIFFVIYFAVPHKYRWAFVLVASYYFYMSWNVGYVFLILGSTTLDYLISKKMAGLPNKAQRKKYLIVSIIFNLGLLFIFKYFNFFGSLISQIIVILGWNYQVPFVDLPLPVGISFYTFQTMSYTIDVYRGKTKAESHFGIFALFVSFFPQLVAGPIERPSRLIPQFYKKIDFDYKRVTSGLKLMTWGLFKKIVIADRLAYYVNTVYSDPSSFDSFALIVATYFFAFQIYCDFSGYSDIAIGVARVFGFELMENFRQPYFSQSISEFWGRWHISLSTWFKDYLYIPLGGNRVAKPRWLLNLLIVFVVSWALAWCKWNLHCLGGGFMVCI